MTEFDFAQLTKLADEGGLPAFLDRVATLLAESNVHASWFEALLLKTRVELGLPIVEEIRLAAIAPAQRAAFEVGYQRACRTVGAALLGAGRIAEAWPYFKAIHEIEPVRVALADFAVANLDAATSTSGEQLDAVIEVGLDGADPVRAFELVLAHRGTCDAITLLEQRASGFPPPVRRTLVTQLLHHFADELKENLRREIAKHEAPVAGEFTVAELLNNRRWLLRSAPHVDDAHLQAVVRFAPLLDDMADLRAAAELCSYGLALPSPLQYREPPPFENFYDDYRALLLALTGVDVDAAVKRFREKVEQLSAEARRKSQFAAEVLVFLLHRAGRSDEAIAAFREHLGAARRLTIAPSLNEICRRAGNYSAVIAAACDRKDLLQFAVAIALEKTRPSD
ncbi:MAG: hypothetical protein ACKVX7_18890 [Planctomycetota bacterium]